MLHYADYSVICPMHADPKCQNTFKKRSCNYYNCITLCCHMYRFFITRGYVNDVKSP